MAGNIPLVGFHDLLCEFLSGHIAVIKPSSKDEDLIRHQKGMGVTTTVLLPAGRYYGLDAMCGGNESCQKIARKYPSSYVYFANELPYLGEAVPVISKYLREGAIGIGE